MKIIEPSYEIISPIDRTYIMKHLEAIGRTCYKSEDKITDESSAPFIRNIIKSGHEAMIEHFSLSVRFVVNRSFTHEIVRHRIASFAQESQRYVNYGKEKHGSEITFIRPTFYKNQKLMDTWELSMKEAEKNYFYLLSDGAKPQEARLVLPNSTRTEIVVTCNLRELRTIFSLRAATPADPAMREIMVPLLKDMKERLPDIFFDLEFEL